MQLTAVITKSDLEAVVEDMFPLRFEMGRRRVVSLSRVSALELVSGRGVRARAAAKLAWDAFGLSIPVDLRALQILFAPSIEARAGRLLLALRPSIEALDIAEAPRFLSGAIEDAASSALAAKEIALDLTRILGKTRALSPRVSPPLAVEVAPSGATVTVTDEALALAIDLEARVVRELAEPSHSAA